MNNEELKSEVMTAFANGCTPVDAVIRFKLAPNKMKTWYEEYIKSKGGLVIWGDVAKELERELGCEIRSADDLIFAVEKLLGVVKH